MTTDEEWRPVPVRGYEHAYSVSDHDRVRSNQREITHRGPWGVLTRRVRQRILKPKPDGFVTLSVGGVPKSVRAGDLARQAFGA